MWVHTTYIFFSIRRRGGYTLILIYESLLSDLKAQICYITKDNMGNKHTGILTLDNKDNLSKEDFVNYILDTAEEKAKYDCDLDNEYSDYDEKENFIKLNWIQLIEGDEVLETLL